jgi:hypothetical protein
LAVDLPVVEAVTDSVLLALSRHEAVPPAALELLVVRYAETGRDDLRDGLEGALALAVERAQTEHEGARRPDWLTLFLEASRLSEDERVRDVSAALADDLQRAWETEHPVAWTMRSIEACLKFGCRQPAIDELERVIGRAYKPGSGLARSPSDPSGPRGSLADQMSTASALIAAYAITDRLPYGMLAEELVQFSRRTWWDQQHAAWGPEPGAPALELFLNACDASRVLHRLALLHQQADYRQAAIVAECDYAGEAEQALAALASQYRDHGARAAPYALAILELG